MNNLVERLRKQAVCVYLATESGPADDLSDGLKKAADRIEALEAALRLAHEWLDPTEMPDADYCVIRAALDPSSPPSATE
jgi:hypothetical protein